MRKLVQEQSILGTDRLALTAVGDHDRRAPGSAHCAQLRGHGERSAAAPAQARALDQVEERVRVELAVRGQQTMGVEVAVEVNHLPTRERAQQARQPNGCRERRHQTGVTWTVPLAEPAAESTRSANPSWSARPSAAATRAAIWVPASDVIAP